ncbi:alkaline phosphatase family protein [Maribacter chungangensis]|uniref:Alkaline phosphatase family protein n=1 Tax=Maribacter chungangensis TaxID=1069117 RepID=A0ABW3B4B4_9FLAO
MNWKIGLQFIIILAISQLLSGQGKTPKVVFVIVDGISADVIEHVSTPNLDAIAAKGGYTRAVMGGKRDGYSQTPTISAVGYNSLLTGTWVNKHNVLGNDIKAPNYNYWTLFRFVDAYKPKLKTAIFSTWLDNRTKLIGEGLAETGNIQLDYHFDGFELDTIAFPNSEDRFLRIDEHVITEASRYIKADSPDLSWVYLQHTDNMGHQYGDSPQFHEAVLQMDDQIGRLWKAILYRKERHNEDWQLYITTDHGRDKETGKGHGGQSDRERLIWIVTNTKNLNSYFTEKKPGIVAIAPTILREMHIRPTKAQLWEMDGIPLTGKISLANLQAVRQDNTLHLTWDSYANKGKLNVYLTTTNTFSEGGKDTYLKMGRVDLSAGKAKIDISGLPASFYKVVLEGKYNSVNTWVVD